MKLKLALGLLLVVIVAVVAISLLTGGDDKNDAPTTAQERSGGGGGDNGGGAESDGAAARLRTTAVKRSEGRNAAASTSDFAEKPKQFWLRVSAAPKQSVKGSWNVSCAGGGKDEDTFVVTPPQLMQLRIPTKNAASCVAGAFAQLSGTGRIKLAILRER